MIIDSHAHLHPSQADVAAWDGNSDDAVLRDHHRTLYVYHRPGTVTAAGEKVSDAWKLPWKDQPPYSWEGRADVYFRVTGETFVWEKDGQTYAAAVRPAADAALLIKLMDAVGVDKVVAG